MKTNVQTWKTESDWVDIETGEIIEKKRIKNGEYILIKTTKNYKKDGETNIKQYCYECRRSKQKRLFE